MSRIENAAKPIVEPMMRGRRTGIPLRDERPLETWLALKTLEADLIPHNAPTPVAADFHAFYATPSPPPGFIAVPRQHCAESTQITLVQLLTVS